MKASFCFRFLILFSFLTSLFTARANLIDYWKFDEGVGGTTSDSAGSCSGTLVNSPKWQSGLSNYALSFNGTSQYVQLSASRIVDTLPNYTIESWINWDGGGSQITIQQIYYEGQGSWDKVTLAIHAGVPKFFVYTQAGTWFTAAAPASITPNQWHHIAATVQSGVGGILYVDGQPAATNTGIGLAASGIPANIVNIGGGYAGSTRDYFSGKIDEVKIFNNTLSASQIAADFHAMDSVRIPAVIQIASLSANGLLTWTNSAMYSNGLFSVEWASAPDGPWKKSWGNLGGMMATNPVMTTGVPMYYRVKCIPNQMMLLPMDFQVLYSVSNAVGVVSTQRITTLGHVCPTLNTNEYTLLEQVILPTNEMKIVLIRSTSDSVYRYSPDSGIETLEYQLGPVGMSWTNNNYESQFTRKVTIEAIENVTVPAGTFPCYKFHKQALEIPGSDWYEWVCPGIGIVKDVDYWVDPVNYPPVTYELQSFGLRP